MFGQTFSHDTIRKYVVYFGSLFDDIYLTRDNRDGNQLQKMKVPLNYAPKEKMLSRLEGNPDLERPIAIQLPRMSFEITNYVYDPTRKLSSSSKISSPSSDPNKFNYQYNPVPYNIDFSLYIMVKNAEDGTRIVEQILPFFTPELTSTLNLNPDVGGSIDIPLVLNNISQLDTYEGQYEIRRAIIWTLNFTMKGYLFGPTRTSNIIKQVEVNTRSIPTGMDIDNANPLNSRAQIQLVITPGLTSNGQPTSNSSITIDKNLISKDDNWAFILDFEENI